MTRLSLTSACSKLWMRISPSLGVFHVDDEVGRRRHHRAIAHHMQPGPMRRGRQAMPCQHSRGEGEPHPSCRPISTARIRLAKSIPHIKTGCARNKTNIAYHS